MQQDQQGRGTARLVARQAHTALPPGRRRRRCGSSREWFSRPRAWVERRDGNRTTVPRHGRSRCPATTEQVFPIGQRERGEHRGRPGGFSAITTGGRGWAVSGRGKPFHEDDLVITRGIEILHSGDLLIVPPGQVEAPGGIVLSATARLHHNEPGPAQPGGVPSPPPASSRARHRGLRDPRRSSTCRRSLRYTALDPSRSSQPPAHPLHPNDS